MSHVAQKPTAMTLAANSILTRQTHGWPGGISFHAPVYILGRVTFDRVHMVFPRPQPVMKMASASPVVTGNLKPR